MKRLNDLEVVVAPLGQFTMPKDVIPKPITELEPEDFEKMVFVKGGPDRDIRGMEKRYHEAVDKYTKDAIVLIEKVIAEEAIKGIEKELLDVQAVDPTAQEYPARLTYSYPRRHGENTLFMLKAMTALKIMTDIRMLSPVLFEMVTGLIENAGKSTPTTVKEIAKSYINIGLQNHSDPDTDLAPIFATFVGRIMPDLPTQYSHTSMFIGIEPFTRRDIEKVRLFSKYSNDLFGGEEKTPHKTAYVMDNVVYDPSNIDKLFISKIVINGYPEYADEVVEFLNKLMKFIPTILKNKNEEVYEDLLLELGWAADSYSYTFYDGSNVMTDRNGNELTDEEFAVVLAKLIDNTIKLYTHDERTPVIMRIEDDERNTRHEFPQFLSFSTIALIKRYYDVATQAK